jgi:hypothetical protein
VLSFAGDIDLVLKKSEEATRRREQLLSSKAPSDGGINKKPRIDVGGHSRAQTPPVSSPLSTQNVEVPVEGRAESRTRIILAETQLPPAAPNMKSPQHGDLAETQAPLNYDDDFGPDNQADAPAYDENDRGSKQQVTSMGKIRSVIEGNGTDFKTPSHEFRESSSNGVVASLMQRHVSPDAEHSEKERSKIRRLTSTNLGGEFAKLVTTICAALQNKENEDKIAGELTNKNDRFGEIFRDKNNKGFGKMRELFVYFIAGEITDTTQWHGQRLIAQFVTVILDALVLLTPLEYRIRMRTLLTENAQMKVFFESYQKTLDTPKFLVQVLNDPALALEKGLYSLVAEQNMNERLMITHLQQGQ